ncbi:uncharacterized protein LOC111408291 [Olea europaea var. sylvestris]|uniref:uncharacterized protein LOC111408291 n=1 Tax=Olea europaea var. sylvestris TaxID=158386 RepID=UPI000C1D1745|nr:uncharacterized protein LOC111408291 [Olea europaea var. sylvestris]
MANCDENLSKDQLAVVLLNFISDKYKDIKVALEYGRDELTLDVITNVLRNKALEIKAESSNSHTGTSFLIKEKSFEKPTQNFKVSKANKRWVDRSKTKNNAKGVFGKHNLGDFGSCEHCILGKQAKLPFQSGIHKSKQGLEYLHADLWGLASEYGIMRHKTVLHTPQQNGMAERMNRTVLNKVRCMLLSSGLPKIFWGEAVKTAAYLINRSPTSALNFAVPEYVWSNSPVNYSYQKVFGCTAHAHQNIGKLEPRSLKCVFLGYDKRVQFEKGYRVIIRNDVIFNESLMPCLEGKENDLTEKDVQIEVKPSYKENENEEHVILPETEIETKHVEEDDSAALPFDEYQLTRDREGRQIRLSTRFDSDAFYVTIKCLLALVTQFKWELDQLDVKTAFMYRKLDEIIYIRQPVGFEEDLKEANMILACTAKVVELKTHYI